MWLLVLVFYKGVNVTFPNLRRMLAAQSILVHNSRAVIKENTTRVVAARQNNLSLWRVILNCMP